MMTSPDDRKINSANSPTFLNGLIARVGLEDISPEI